MLSARMERALLPAPPGLLGVVVFFRSLFQKAVTPTSQPWRRGVGKGNPAASVGDCSSHCQS